MPRPAAARRRHLAIEPLEDRTVPAFNLAIDGDPTGSTNVTTDTTTIPGVTIFSPNATLAVLDVDDIETALAAGDVLITTGSGGAQAGNITWAWNGFDDDLDYADSAVRTLTIRPDASSTVGSYSADLVSFNFNDNVNLVIDTTAPATDASIFLLNDSRINFARSVNLLAGTGAITLNSLSADPLAESGSVTVTAGAFQNTEATFLVRSELGNVTFNAPIDLSAAGFGIRAEQGTLRLNAAVNGANDLTLYGGDVIIDAPVGATTPLTTLTFAGGNVLFGTNPITAAAVFVGDGNFDPLDASFGLGTGTVSADVTVQSDGDLAPGGVGVAGNIFIVGNLTFDGGDYAIDLGLAWDKVDVTGDVTINFGRLGSEASTGALTSTADRQIISLTGTLTGEFFNAPLDFSLAVGADAVRVTNYASAPTGVTIAQVPGAPGRKATGTDFDGTAYTAALTGGGDLVVFPDQFNQITIVTRNTTPLSRVVLTTRTNASDDLVAIGPVRINGPLAGFIAAKANLTGDFSASGPVKSLAFANAFSPITLGGSPTDKSTLRAESIFSTVTTPGILSAVTTTGDFSGTITANGVGRVKIGGSLFGFGQTWAVTNGMTSISAARIDGLDLTAKFLGSLTVTGNIPRHISGDIGNSVVRLTGNDGTLGKFGLKTLIARGLVANSSILVEEGNVGTVTVGRFFNSQLYLDYTPAGTFNLGGLFDSVTAFKLTRFTTTATTIGDPNNELNWAFEGSQVVADTIGTVRLSGLRTDNFGGAFGFKFRTAGGSLQTRTTDAAIPLNFNLAPATGALAADFFFLDT